MDVSYLSVENKKVSFWELDDFKKAISYFNGKSLQNEHRKLVFELLFYTGLRIGELSALSWSNVDLKKIRLQLKKL